MTDTYRHYIDQFVALAKGATPDPVRRALRERFGDLPAGAEPLLPPPAPVRDDPDDLALLFRVCDALVTRADSATVEHLREAVATEAQAALSRLFRAPDDPAALRDADRFARLAGYCEVSASPALAHGLRAALWGLVVGTPGRSLTDMFAWPAPQREAGRRALDLWTAAAPTEPARADPPGDAGLLDMALTTALEKQLVSYTEDDGRVLITLFRALLAADAGMAAAAFFRVGEGMGKALDETAGWPSDKRDPLEVLHHHWLGLCWEFGRAFEPGWPVTAAFADGLEKGVAALARPFHGTREVLRIALEQLAVCGGSALAQQVEGRLAVVEGGAGRSAEIQKVPERPERRRVSGCEAR